MSAVAGRLVAIEGVTGSGKSFVSDRLTQRLTKRACRVLQMGGFRPEAQQRPANDVTKLLRRLMEQSRFLDLPFLTETLLLLAEQTMNVETFALKALEDGETILYENFDDALIAYQASRWQRSSASRKEVLSALQALAELQHKPFRLPTPQLTVHVTAAHAVIVTRLRSRDAKVITAGDERMIRSAGRMYAALYRQPRVRRVITLSNSGTQEDLDKQLDLIEAQIARLPE